MAVNPGLYLDRFLQYYGSPPQREVSRERMVGEERLYRGRSWSYCQPPLLWPVGIPSPGISYQPFAGDTRQLRQMRKEEQEERRESLAAWIGGIGTVIVAGLGAYVLKSYVEDRKAWKDAKEFQTNVLPQLSNHPQVDFQSLSQVTQKHVELLESKLAKGRRIVLLTAGVFACAAAAFVGGMFGFPWLITASIVGGVALATIGVFSCVWHWNDPTSLSREELRQMQIQRNQFLPNYEPGYD